MDDDNRKVENITSNVLALGTGAVGGPLLGPLCGALFSTAVNTPCDVGLGALVPCRNVFGLAPMYLSSGASQWGGYGLGVLLAALTWVLAHSLFAARRGVAQWWQSMH